MALSLYQLQTERVIDAFNDNYVLTDIMLDHAHDVYDGRKVVVRNRVSFDVAWVRS
jgi:hypothetical protein